MPRRIKRKINFKLGILEVIKAPIYKNKMAAAIKDINKYIKPTFYSTAKKYSVSYITLYIKILDSVMGYTRLLGRASRRFDFLD